MPEPRLDTEPQTDARRSPARVLILGGTAEAAELASVLDRTPGVAVTSSLAGRTRTPGALAGSLRIGGFGGVKGLVSYLREHMFEAVVDATHPFAAQVSANAAAACDEVGVPRVALSRPSWRAQAGDRWYEVANAEAAAACLPGLGSQPPRCVLLALGQRDLLPFAALAMRFVLRAVEQPTVPAGLTHEVVLARGPFALDAELDLLRRYCIDAIVARNSGGTGAYAKLTAARELGLPVVLISRPPSPPAPCVESMGGVLDWLRAVGLPGRSSGCMD